MQALEPITPNQPTPSTKPIAITLTGEAGKRVILHTAKRILREHHKEIKVLADKL